MLRVRIGDELKTHVKALLLRLRERHLKNGTLMDAFAYITAMHAEHIFILTKEVLAEALNCKLSDIKKKVTGPLGDEAAVSTGGDRIYTRHRAIAETAVEVLSGTFHVDFEEIILDLAEAAIRLYNQGLYVPYLGQWRHLSDHFMKKGLKSFAIRLAQSLLKIDTGNLAYSISHLSSLLREAGQPELSAKLYRESHVQGDRASFFEWSVTEELLGNYALAIWLNGIALSDKVETKPIDNRQASMCMFKLIVNFYSLFESYNSHIFLEGCGAATQIGEKFRMTATDRDILDTYHKKCKERKVPDVDSKTAVQKMSLGIIKAWEQKEVELGSWITPGSELTFKRFGRLVGVEDI